MFLLIKKRIDKLFKQTKIKPRNTWIAECWLCKSSSLRDQRFEATHSVFNITDENNGFWITTLGQWTPGGCGEFIEELNRILELSSENDFELHVKEVEKRGTQIEIENRGYNLAGFDFFKSEIIAELRRVKYNDVENIIYRIELTYDEMVDIFDIDYIGASTIGYTLLPGIYEISDLNLMLKSLLPNEVKTNITIDDIRLRSNLTTKKIIKFGKKSFSYTILGLTQSDSDSLIDPPQGFL